MLEEALLEVFTVMGRGPEDVRAAMAGLVASGSARARAARIASRRPSAGRPLDGLLAEARGDGIRPEAFDRVISAMADLGRIAMVGGVARLRSDLCGPAASRGRGLDRVLLPGRDSFRAVLALMAIQRGCRLPLDDREGLVRDLGLIARERLLLGSDMSDEAASALSRRLSEALDDPGPAFRVEEGEPVARYCMPEASAGAGAGRVGAKGGRHPRGNPANLAALVAEVLDNPARPGEIDATAANRWSPHCTPRPR